jgi:hypothetical protein
VESSYFHRRAVRWSLTSKSKCTTCIDRNLTSRSWEVMYLDSSTRLPRLTPFALVTARALFICGLWNRLVLIVLFWVEIQGRDVVLTGGRCGCAGAGHIPIGPAGGCEREVRRVTSMVGWGSAAHRRSFIVSGYRGTLTIRGECVVAAVGGTDAIWQAWAVLSTGGGKSNNSIGKFLAVLRAHLSSGGRIGARG